MSDNIKIDNLYLEGEHWVQNLGEKTIHAKRMGGKFRNIKWLAMTVWLPFFLGPYITWNNKQAILFDVENRQYHLFDLTIFPQDIWMLTMILLFFAILLAAMTAILGRVFCGYFCFQTVWSDIFTQVEQWVEGTPLRRYKLEKAPFSFNKIRIKLTKHLLWILISILSGVTWMLYFGVTWDDYFSWTITSTTLFITLLIASGSYIFAGFMREQTCMWICPYSRIQGTMCDEQSIMPTYDFYRGEKRGKLKKGQFVEGFGDCIDCNQCVAVCPTGVDIRKGQEYGCTTCGLCIDACDMVMEKVGKPLGLIRYTSLDEMKFNKPLKAIYKRGRVIVYSTILTISLLVLIYGMFNISTIDFKVLHDRQPLFVQLSDGSIRNKYELKVMNKTDEEMQITIDVRSFIQDLKIKNNPDEIIISSGNVKSIYIYLSAFEKNVGTNNDVTFIVKNNSSSEQYKSTFFTPSNM